MTNDSINLIAKYLEDLASEQVKNKSLQERKKLDEIAFEFVNKLEGTQSFRRQYWIKYYYNQKVEATREIYK